MNQSPTILDLMDGPLSATFSGDTWRAWRIALRAIFGLPIEDIRDLGLLEDATGRSEPPTRQVAEAFLLVGRRGGKSFISSLCAVYLSVFRTYQLSPGERGVVQVIASDRQQARVCLRYIKAMLRGTCPALIEDERAESVDLGNGITIQVTTSSSRAVRGPTVVACICDEISFWKDDQSADPAAEVLNAIRPAMATVPNALLLCIGSVYRKQGPAYEAWESYWGRDDPEVLVWRADTRTMNPSVPQRVIDKALERDAASARAEYLSEWREDLEDFISRDLVMANVVPGRGDLPINRGVTYYAACDPSGGRADSMVLSLGFMDRDKAVISHIAEAVPPFNPDEVVRDFARTCKAHGVHELVSDRYGAEWVSSRFAAHQIKVLPSERSASEIFLAALPLFTGARLALPDNKRLVSQLTSLERRKSRTGRDLVSHPNRTGHHDDVAVAVCGAALAALDHVGDGPAFLDRFSLAPRTAEDLSVIS